MKICTKNFINENMTIFENFRKKIIKFGLSMMEKN
jgi:hypothetical protein